MTEMNQLPLPPSFVALFIPPGRTRPLESREHMLARYELCEDLAQTLLDRARMLLLQLGVAEEDVLERIQAALADEDSGLDPREAGWVVRRLAELLGWPLPPGMPGAGEDRPDDPA
jgi:hypothetical protein